MTNAELLKWFDFAWPDNPDDADSILCPICDSPDKAPCKPPHPCDTARDEIVEMIKNRAEIETMGDHKRDFEAKK